MKSKKVYLEPMAEVSQFCLSDIMRASTENYVDWNDGDGWTQSGEDIWL